MLGALGEGEISRLYFRSEGTIRDRHFIFVSGLPASGKTTLARMPAPALGLPLLDKDDILEALYDTVGVGDLDWRQKLSRASDAVLMRLAAESQGAILASFWRHPSIEGSSGTPSAWLGQLPGVIVEVHCRCPVETALARFRSRTRHRGHNDAARPDGDLAEQFRLAAAHGPLAMGHLVDVDTSMPCDVSAILADVRALSQSE